jgi:hypothetical protein
VFVAANICANGTARKLEGYTGISASNENEEEVEMIHRQDAFYSFSTFQSCTSIQTVFGFSNSYDSAQTAQVDYYVSPNLTHVRSYVLVYVYVRQLYIYYI